MSALGGLGRSGRARIVALGVLSMITACSSGPPSPGPSTRAADSAPASALATGSASTTGKPLDCPPLKPAQYPSARLPMPCISTALITPRAIAAGLKRATELAPASDPAVRNLYYDFIDNGVLASAEVVLMVHLDNGALIQLTCNGIANGHLDAVLSVCTDIGTVAHADVAAVRAWALRAEASIATHRAAVPRFTSGDLLYVACQDPDYLPGVPTMASQIHLLVQARANAYQDGDCAIT